MFRDHFVYVSFPHSQTSEPHLHVKLPSVIRRSWHFEVSPIHLKDEAVHTLVLNNEYFLGKENLACCSEKVLMHEMISFMEADHGWT